LRQRCGADQGCAGLAEEQGLLDQVAPELLVRQGLSDEEIDAADRGAEYGAQAAKFPAFG